MKPTPPSCTSLTFRPRNGTVTGVPIPPAQNVRAVYPIAVVKDSSHRAVAAAFEAYVVSAAGQRTLRQFGFLAP